MKLRSFLSGLLALVVVLLLIGVGGFFWIAANSPLKILTAGAGKLPSAAIFVPKQAPAMVSLLVNPDDLKAFRQVIAPPNKRRQARAELAQFEQGLLANTGLTYAQDIQPWLGNEVTLAITTLDIDRDRANGKQPGYLLAIATQDPERSREFLQVFWQKRAIAGTDLTFEQYKGVKLIYNEVPVQQKAEGKKQKAERKSSDATLYSLLPTPSLASAVVGDQFVLFANDPKVLRDAVTNVQAAELNLNQASFYTQALDTLTQPRIGLAFVNLPGLAQWLETESMTSTKEGQEKEKLAAAKQPAQAQTLAIALELNRQGVIAETAMTGTSGKTAIVPTLTKPVEALQYIPATSSFVASGTNLNRLWNELATSLASYKAVAQLVNQSLQGFEKQKHLNLPEDIFRWVTNEYALAAVPAQPEANETVGQKAKGKKAKTALSEQAEIGDWIFVAERGAQETSKTAIAHLDDIAKQHGYSVGAVQLGDQTVSAWTKLTSSNPFSKTLQAEVQGVHATVGQYELFATSLPAMEKALSAVDASLAKSDRFQQAISPFQNPNNGYLYLDWSESRPLLEQRLPLLKVLEVAGGSLFNHLQSFTISSYGRKEGVQRGSVFIKLS